jgi:hypothetical protein
MAGPDIRAVREAYPVLHFAAVTGLEDRALALGDRRRRQRLSSNPHRRTDPARSRRDGGRDLSSQRHRDAGCQIHLDATGSIAEGRKVADLPLTHRQRDVISQLASGLQQGDRAPLGLAEAR